MIVYVILGVECNKEEKNAIKSKNAHAKVSMNDEEEE